MATIAGLKIQIQASFGNIVKDAQNVADNINSLSRVVRQSAPSMQQLEQATKAAGTALDTFLDAATDPNVKNSIVDDMEKGINKLLDSIGTLGDKTAQQFAKLPSTFEGVNEALKSTQKLMDFQNVAQKNPLIKNVDEIKQAIERMTGESGNLLQRFADNIKNVNPSIAGLKTAIERLQNVKAAAASFTALGGEIGVADNAIQTAMDNVIEIGNAIADNILDIKPSMEGIMMAQRKVQKLRDLISQSGLTNELAGALETAENNVAELASRTAEAQTEMTMFQSVVFGMNNLPFQILHDLLKQIAGTIQKLFPISDQMKILAAILVSVVTLIGLASTRTFSWAAGQTYLNSLWQSNIIVRGLSAAVTGIWSAAMGTASWLAVQLGLNTAWTYFMAATGVGVILVLIGLIVVGIYKLIGYFTSVTDKTDQLAVRTKMLQDVTEKYKNNLKGINDEYNKIFDVVSKIREAAKTPATKAVDRENELQSAINAPAAITRQIGVLQRQIQERNKLIDAAIRDGDDALVKELTERQNAAADVINDLRDNRDNVKPLTAAEITAQRSANIQSEMGDRDIAKYLPQISAIDEAARAQKEIREMFAAGKITMQRRDEMMSEVQKTFEANDEEFQATAKEAERTKKLIEDYEAAAKTPLQKFDELKTALDKYKNDLTAAEYKTLTGQLNDNLASQLGISEYLKSADSAAQKQKELDKVLNNLQTYFESGAIGMQEMLEAQERAKIAFTESEQKAEPVGNKPVAQTAALERGTAAYYAAINQRNDPQLNEAKKQTKTLETIAKNTKPQTTLEPQYADIA